MVIRFEAEDKGQIVIEKLSPDRIGVFVDISEEIKPIVGILDKRSARMLAHSLLSMTDES